MNIKVEKYKDRFEISGLSDGIYGISEKDAKQFRNELDNALKTLNQKTSLKEIDDQLTKIDHLLIKRQTMLRKLKELDNDIRNELIELRVDFKHRHIITD